MSGSEYLLLGVLALVFVVLFALERLAPLRKRRRPQVPRLVVNALVALLALATAAAVVSPTADVLLAHSEQFGLLAWLSLPWPIEIALGIVLLDLTFYWWHRANHQYSLLWRFHLAHHIDPDVDVSSAFRFHFGEIVFSVAFRAAQIITLGVPAFTFLAYEAIFQTGTMFHHSNVRLPERMDRALRFVFVTPRMHGIHHSQKQAETCSNFSVVFSVWDRLHRTFRSEPAARAIVIGVPAYDRPGDNGIGAVLAVPFRKQRSYWSGSDATCGPATSRRIGPVDEPSAHQK